MATVWYFWHGFNIVTPLFITVCQMFGSRRTPSVPPSLLVFCIDRSKARVSSSIVLYRVPRSVLSLWRRNRNRMESYRVSTVDVPESGIASNIRGPWLQQRCNSLYCHEEWWGSVPSSVATCYTQSPENVLGYYDLVSLQFWSRNVALVL